MPFTQENKPLLEEAATIDFKLKKNGAINPFYHNSYERGLFFIKKAIEIHGNKYGYGKVNYVNNSTNVTITCAQHRDFEQIPNNHLKGSNCPKCSGRHVPSTEEFVAKARIIHGDKYDYSFTQYKSMHDMLAIVCPIHGLFHTTATTHISGSNCPKCFRDSLTYSTEEWIAKARIIHKDKYDYSKVIYKNSKEKTEIICPLHGSFLQLPSHHLRFHGCPRCAGHNHNILYLLKCLDTGWYKVGVTTDTVQNRISSIGGNLEEVHHVQLEDPRKHEAILHKQYSKEREYNLCVRDGKTEFFSLTEEQVKEVIDYMNDEVSNER